MRVPRKPCFPGSKTLNLLAAAAALAAASAASLAPKQALAWGSYGHEQVQAAALELIQGTSFGQCLARSRAALVRLSITPDYDWKTLGTAPENDTLRKRRSEANAWEHPLHYFEADAFTGPMKGGDFTPILALPNEPYPAAAAKYRELLDRTVDYVAAMDPGKASPGGAATEAQVAKHGTAPWRIQQLLELGALQLKENRLDLAVVYLGAMGHYVGDLSQPFHVTLDFDGQAYPRLAQGIHHAFEEAILEERAKTVGAKRDALSVWSSLAATHDAVVGHGRKALDETRARLRTRDADHVPLVGPKWLLPELFRLAAGDFPYIEPLLAAYADACEEANRARGEAAYYCKEGPAPARGKRRAAPRATVGIYHRFLDAEIKPGAAAPPLKVIDAAQERMGAGAAMLARLWLTAYQQAGSPDLGACAEIPYDRGVVITHYPRPRYLPEPAIRKRR